MITIRKANANDSHPAAILACELWPDHTPEDLEPDLLALILQVNAAIFLAMEDSRAVGFAQCQLRHDYVEGTATSPVGYLEGLYMRPEYRHKGIAKALLAACEAWAGEQGCREFASDCELTNYDSFRFHLALGFQEANRIICFSKKPDG